MTILDWGIVAAYLTAALGIGILLTRKASTGTTDFFIAGRSLPWYVAGTSMVATTFSSDTPLFVAGAVREQGIYANWFWWSGGIGVLVSVFFFAGLWRRTEALTEIEFIAQRYDKGPAADTLRIIKALFDGVFINCVIMASVTLAMSKVIVVILGLSTTPLFTVPLFGEVTPVVLVLVILGIAAVFYTTLSGIYGVVYTDLIQFGLAMVGAIALSVIVYSDLAERGGVVTNILKAQGFNPMTLQMFPDFGWDLNTATFCILLTVGWWSQAPGTGYFIQRILATRSEKDAMLSVYWFAFCHYVLRSWPWIIVGAASLVYFPALADAEQSYPQMIDHFLPMGLKGIMVASLLAAFMSTLDTHMNWGSSYIVNDIYKPYIATGRSPRHYVKVARLVMLTLTLLAIIVATRMTSILGMYLYLAVFLTGTSFVMVARWYWWRINIWSELSSLLTAALVGNALLFLVPDQPGEEWFGVRILITVIATMTVCIIVTLLTSQTGPTRQTIAFYKRLRIHGRGWERVRQLTSVAPLSGSLKDNLIVCLASIGLLYSLLLGVGHSLLGQWNPFFVYICIAVIAAFIVSKKMPRVLAQLRQTVTD